MSLGIGWVLGNLLLQGGDGPIYVARGKKLSWTVGAICQQSEKWNEEQPKKNSTAGPMPAVGLASCPRG